MASKIANLESMLTDGQESALLRYSLANAYAQQKDFAVALQHYVKSLELDPTYSAAWKGYAKALADSGQLQEAVQVYMQGIEVAEKKKDIQAAKEMKIFLKRLQK